MRDVRQLDTDKNLLADSCYSFTLNRGSPFRRGLLGYRVRSRVAKVEFQPTMSYSLQAPFKCQNNSASRVRICVPEVFLFPSDVEFRPRPSVSLPLTETTQGKFSRGH
jgi:hypothetical protein